MHSNFNGTYVHFRNGASASENPFHAAASKHMKLFVHNQMNGSSGFMEADRQVTSIISNHNAKAGANFLLDKSAQEKLEQGFFNAQRQESGNNTKFVFVLD